MKVVLVSALLLATCALAALPAEARVVACIDVGGPTDCGGYWLCYPDSLGTTRCVHCPFENTGGCDWWPDPGPWP